MKKEQKKKSVGSADGGKKGGKERETRERKVTAGNIKKNKKIKKNNFLNISVTHPMNYPFLNDKLIYLN